MTKESSSNSTGMQYNTSLSVMTNAEYGRSIHRMIEYCLTLEDRNERSRCASSIVRVMIILNPQMKEFAEYEHKIWDHLHIISNYKLDIDSPFPEPRPELIESKPEIVPYPKSSIRFKHYGKILEDLLKKALAETDPKAKEVFTEQLAQLMKRHYLNWNRDSVNDQLILEQLENLSEGNLKVGENFRFLHTSEILPKNAIPQNQIQHAVKKKSNNMHKKKKR